MHHDELEEYRCRLERLGRQIEQEMQQQIGRSPVPLQGPHMQRATYGTELVLDDERDLLYTAIRQALDRIAHDEFGTCAICGAPINVARLSVVPYAAKCRSCEYELKLDHVTAGTAADATDRIGSSQQNLQQSLRNP